MTTYDFASSVGESLQRLHCVLEQRYPDIGPVQVTDPKLLFAPDAEIKYAIRHAKWVTLAAAQYLHNAWYLEAARRRAWVSRFSFESEIISFEDLFYIEQCQTTNRGG